MKRKPLFLLCLALIVCGAFVYFEYSKPKANIVTVLVSTPQLQSVDIGSCKDLEAGQRAAIQELSRQLTARPKVREFQVHWLNDGRDLYLRYDRNSRWLQNYGGGAVTKSQFPWFSPFSRHTTIFYEPSILSASNEPVTTEKTIHEAARQNLALDEFQKKN